MGYVFTMFVIVQLEQFFKTLIDNRVNFVYLSSDQFSWGALRAQFNKSELC